YFNNVPEKGKAVKYGNSPPVLKAPTREQQRQLAGLQAGLDAAARRCGQLEPALLRALCEWAAAGPRPAEPNWSPAAGLLAPLPLARAAAARRPPGRPAAFQGGPPAFADGRVGAAARFDGRRYLDAGDLGGFGFFDRFSLAAWVWADGPEGGTLL